MVSWSHPEGSCYLNLHDVSFPFVLESKQVKDEMDFLFTFP